MRLFRDFVDFRTDIENGKGEKPVTRYPKLSKSPEISFTKPLCRWPTAFQRIPIPLESVNRENIFRALSPNKAGRVANRRVYGR